MRIGIAGRLANWKGQHVFIEAANSLLQKYPHLEFWIIGAPLFGEEAYEKSLRKRVQELKLDDKIKFCGFIENMKELLGQLDIVVHASIIPEPFGQVILEGMALGRPVIATAGGGVLEIISSEEVGILIPMGDHVAMAQAIERCLLEPKAAIQMGECAREHVRQHFTVEATAEKLEEIYQQHFKIFC